MNDCVVTALAICLAASAWGREAVPAALPPAVHADTETVTNVPFTAAFDAAGRLSFDLVCRATPSNNDAPLGSFSVAVTPDGTVFFVR